jgi:hypothetical protein
MSADDLAREGLGLIAAQLQDRGWRRVSGTSDQLELAISEQVTARLNYAIAKYDRPAQAKVTPYVGVAIRTWSGGGRNTGLRFYSPPQGQRQPQPS